MVLRKFWISQIEEAWKKRPIVWLGGVRRVGKTHLCKSLDDVQYYNCELPRVRNLLEDPEHFYATNLAKRIVFDEIHTLADPSLVLKIAADEFPDKRIIATGSSTLGAQKKFSDTLAGRKIDMQLTPMLLQESALFGNSSLEHRMLFGGLPPFFMSKTLPEELCREWLISYYARDVQVLYEIRKEKVYIKFVELLLTRSGGIFQVSHFANDCKISRQTIAKYLHIAEKTFVARIIPPFGTKASKEIILAPKVYGFDTGFVCYAKGWEVLRKEYFGELWEHLVLNTIVGMHRNIRVRYWRDKRGREIDFILQKNRNKLPIALECKLSYRDLDARNLAAFRERHPEGLNIVVTPDVRESFSKKMNGLEVHFTSLDTLSSFLN